MKTTLEVIKEHKIIAIIRGLEQKKMVKVAQALYDGGIRLIEVTFDQKGDNINTFEAIKSLCTHFGEDICVGAGTVMTLEQLELARQAGARYIISPNTNEVIVRKTKEMGLVSMPGALTPSEIANAREYGADIVKLFPAGSLGIGYIKAVRAPMGHIPLAVVGGVDENNIQDYINIGINCFGIGANIVKMSLIEEEKYSEITKLALKYTEKIK